MPISVFFFGWVFCSLVSISSMVFWPVWAVAEQRVSTQVGNWDMAMRRGGIGGRVQEGRYLNRVCTRSIGKSGVLVPGSGLGFDVYP